MSCDFPTRLPDLNEQEVIANFCSSDYGFSSQLQPSWPIGWELNSPGEVLSTSCHRDQHPHLAAYQVTLVLNHLTQSLLIWRIVCVCVVWCGVVCMWCACGVRGMCVGREKGGELGENEIIWDLFATTLRVVLTINPPAKFIMSLSTANITVSYHFRYFPNWSFVFSCRQAGSFAEKFMKYKVGLQGTTINQTVYQFPGPISDSEQLKPSPSTGINTNVTSVSSQMQTNWYGNYVSHSPVGYGHFQSPSSFKLSVPSHHNVPISPLAISPKVEAKLEGSLD